MSARLRCLGLVVGLVGAGCFDAGQGETPFACSADGACPDGYRCAGGLCHRDATDAPVAVDAPAADASVDAASAVDAAPLVDAVALVDAVPPPVHCAGARIAARRSYWNARHTAILSELAVVGADGIGQSRLVLGGTVDGIGMIQVPLYGLLGYVPAVNSRQVLLRWTSSPVVVQPNSAGTTQVSVASVVDAIRASASAWNQATAGCGRIELGVGPAEPVEVGYDGKNLIVFRDDAWCHAGDCSLPGNVLDPNAAAVTTLFYVDSPNQTDDGSLLDADIEVNGVDFAIAVGCETACVSNSTHTVFSDLQNTLTHELGHVLGLSHTCRTDLSQPALLDGDCAPQPSCDPVSALPPVITEATMYPVETPGEIKKRSPELDDVEGICATYPR